MYEIAMPPMCTRSQPPPSLSRFGLVLTLHRPRAVHELSGPAAMAPWKIVAGVRPRTR